VTLSTKGCHLSKELTSVKNWTFSRFLICLVDFELRVWTIKRVQTPKTLTSDLLFSIFRAFREHGIEIPFPQRDVHLKTVSASIPISSVS
jgi:small-conductance mechanosensitive channel